MHYLFDIEDVFDLSGIGPVITPGIPYSSLPPDRQIAVGSELLIVSPDGGELRTVIASFPMIRRLNPTDHALFALPKSITKAQLPVGAKVYALALTAV